MRVNVAQYCMQDLAGRFPIKGETGVDHEIIDVLVDNWSKHQYVAPHSAVKLNHRPFDHHSYLM